MTTTRHMHGYGAGGAGLIAVSAYGEHWWKLPAELVGPVVMGYLIGIDEQFPLHIHDLLTHYAG